MAQVPIKIKTLAPIHLSSGQADINVDAEVIHDAYGMPYFPARRFRGLLYESAIEAVEMAELSNRKFLTIDTVNELFHHKLTTVQMVVPDFYLENYGQMKTDWAYLQEHYGAYLQPEDVLGEYTSIRYQTEIDKQTGTAKKSSLHNLRVVDAGLMFCGEIELFNAEARHYEALAMALRNLTTAGMKRNRGFGHIQCTMPEQQVLIESALRKDAV